MVEPMLEAAHKEMSELSKKRQDGILNELKVRYINRLLAEAHAALGDDPSLAFVELLNEDELPQNSDAVLVLGQWLARSEEHTSELQSLMRSSYAVFCLTKQHKTTACIHKIGTRQYHDLLT